MEPKALDNLASIRTDVVGSLLRPNRLKQAYAEREQKKINDDDLRRIEDEAIREAVRMQEEVGLDVITDGEYRCLNLQDSFSASVSCFDARGVNLSFILSLSRDGIPLQVVKP